MQVLEQWCTQNTIPRLKYIQERFGKVELFKNEDLEPFYRGKIIRGSTGRVGGRSVD